MLNEDKYGLGHFFLLFSEFLTPAWADGLSLELYLEQVSSSLQDSFQYLADPNAVIWIVSTHFISRFSSLFINPLVTVPSDLTTIGITFTFLFHSF